MLIVHADVNRARVLAEENKREELALYLNSLIESMATGGAEFTAIVAATPHICAAELTRISPLPLIDMVAEIAEAVRARGLKRIALFGTRSTVESRMFGRLGVDVIMPKPDEIDLIHNTYLDVLYDRSTPAQIDRLRELAHTLITRDGAESVLLAGTDLTMVMNEDTAGFPTIDCARVHIDAIVRRRLD
jgi:aspartate racemase